MNTRTDFVHLGLRSGLSKYVLCRGVAKLTRGLYSPRNEQRLEDVMNHSLELIGSKPDACVYEIPQL